MILFTPGPVRLPPTVSEALRSPPCDYHRQPAFSAMLEETEGSLKALLGIRAPERYFVTQICATGTGAVEACLAAVAVLGRGAIVTNGYFGARAADQAAQAGLDAAVISLPEDKPIDPAALEEALDREPGARWLFFVSHETRIGLANPTVAIGRLAKRRGLFVAADLISSAYAYPIDVEAAELDLAVAASAKGLMSAPGLGLILTRDEAIETLRRAPRPRSYYLDLVAEHDRQRGTRQPRFAQPVALHAALHAACQHLTRIGIDTHFTRIRRQLEALRGHLEALGVPPTHDPRWSGGVAMSFRLPAHLPYERFSASMQQEGYFLLYGIPGDPTHFQISTLGHLEDAHVEGLKGALSRCLR